LFISTKKVLVWGEHNALLVRGLYEIVQGMKRWLAAEGKGQMALFEKWGCREFIPNVNPDLQAFFAASRRFFDESLGNESLRRGYERWGFKEIRYGCREALFLQELFPDASFVLLFRDPRDCLRSIKSTAWYKKDYGRNPRSFLATWGRLSGELLRASKRLRRCRVVRYEQLIADRERHIEQLAEISGIRPDLFDRAVFANRVRDSKSPPRRLDSTDFAALASPELQRIAAMLGYFLGDESQPDSTRVEESPGLHAGLVADLLSAGGFRAAGAMARPFLGVGNLLVKALHAAGFALPPGNGSIGDRAPR